MPAKSRRNRRNISQGPKTTINRSAVSPADVTSAEAARPEKTVNKYSSSARAAAAMEDPTSFIQKELKWITLVTVIVAVILVILYIVLH